MDIGIGLPNMVRDVRGSVIPRWARTAEEAGFSSLGTIGRLAYPSVMETVALAAAAAVTSRVGLVTGVLLAPTWPAVLLAKEAASIDAIADGRLTLGIGLGARPDDYTVQGREPKRLGKQLDKDLETYGKAWRGEVLPGTDNPVVPAGTREVPLLFAGFAPQAFRRMVKYGVGYMAASVPPPMAAVSFEQARNAWKEAGKPGSPRLVAIAYYTLTDADKGRSNVSDYYAFMGEAMSAHFGQGVLASPEAVKDGVNAFADIGADEFILNPGADHPDEVKRLAEVVL